MINKLTEIRINKLLTDGTPEKEIRADFLLNRFLTSQEFDLLIAQKELGQTNEPEQSDNSPRKEQDVKSKPKGEHISFKLDKELLKKLNLYIERTGNHSIEEKGIYYLKGNKKSSVIRYALEKFLNENLI